MTESGFANNIKKISPEILQVFEGWLQEAEDFLSEVEFEDAEDEFFRVTILMYLSEMLDPVPEGDEK